MFFFIPYKIDRRFDTPWVTITLIAACVLVYFLTITQLDTAVQVFAFRPNLFAPITWFTSMFLHGGLLHLLGNVYFLWLFGGVVEDAVGKVRYIGLYCAGGLVAALSHLLVTAAFTPKDFGIPLIGASGAIAAVMGVAAVRLYREQLSVFWFVAVLLFWRKGTFALSAAFGVGLYFVREVFDGVLATFVAGDGVAHWAHIGGVAFGAAAALAFGLAKDMDAEVYTREAETYAAAGMDEIAAERYAKVADLRQEDAEARLGVVRHALLAAAGTTADARENARGQVRELLHSLLHENRRADAANAFGTLVRIDGGGFGLDAASLLTIGMACEGRRDQTAAAAAFYETYARYPGTPEAEKSLFRLAHAYLALGQADEAQATWAAFKTLYPNSEWAPYADAGLSYAG